MVARFFLAVLAASAIGASPALAQVYQGPGAYSTYGNTTYGPNGTTQQTYGNQTYVQGPNGAPTTTYSTYGSQTYGSNGTTYSTHGNTTYGSNGTTATTYGNQTYIQGQDGKARICSTYGRQTYCD